MNKKRAEFIYNLLGQITEKKPRKTQKVKYVDSYFYQLNIICENRPEVKKIFAFPDRLVNPEIWLTIEQGRCFQQNYKLLCRNYAGYFYLIDWEELKD